MNLIVQCQLKNTIMSICCITKYVFPSSIWNIKKCIIAKKILYKTLVLSLLINSDKRFLRKARMRTTLKICHWIREKKKKLLLLSLPAVSVYQEVPKEKRERETHFYGADCYSLPAKLQRGCQKIGLHAKCLGIWQFGTLFSRIHQKGI